MAASAESCSHCGKQGVGLKRCSRCKQASYCGAACQNAGWKGHKKTCAPPVSLSDVVANMNAAGALRDWRGVLKWEGRMEELMAPGSDVGCSILQVFADAHLRRFTETTSRYHALSFVGLEERRIPLLGKLQRFRDQGEAMCDLAGMLLGISNKTGASVWFQRARDVGAAHGFFVVESKACTGLGSLAMDQGRHEEGLALLRNAVAAAQLNELDDPSYVAIAMTELVDALFTADAIDEVEPLVSRYREAAKAQSERLGGFSPAEVQGMVATSRLHEARGRPQEAAKEVRALLDLMRDNKAAVTNSATELSATGCNLVLEAAINTLKVLDPEVGDKELIKGVADQLAKLRM